jgi:hypothetical protein
MHRTTLVSPAIAALLATAAAHSAVDLIATGSISGKYEDYSVQTAPSLESGVPGNALGGIGSALAYAGCNTFLALPDRGPNALTYNAAVDSTTSYIPRFHTLHLSLAASDAGSALPFTLTPFVTDTTLLSSSTPLYYSDGKAFGLPNGRPALNAKTRAFYFTGRSDNFDSSKLSTSPNNGRLDPEGIRVSNDGQTVFITDEYGPYIYQFDRDSGRRVRVFNLPAKFAVKNLSALGDTEISGNTVGRVANKGMEGLAITPDGRYLVGAMQSPLLQDGGTNAAFTRLVKVDTRSGAIKEYAYELTNIGTDAKPKYGTISEIVAINGHEFLVDERDGKGLGDASNAVVKRLYRIDLNDATEVSSLIGSSQLANAAVSKTLFLDIVAALTANGFDVQDIPAKLEGIAFGADVTIEGAKKHTLFISNDNDYLATIIDANHPSGADNSNRWFVFSFGDDDLPNFTPQAIETSYSCGDDHRPWHDWFHALNDFGR